MMVVMALIVMLLIGIICIEVWLIWSLRRDIRKLEDTWHGD